MGQRGQGAGILPQMEGIIFSLPTYYYSADASGSGSLPIGGTLSLGLDADVFLALPTVLWLTPFDVLGGDLAFSGTFVYGNSDVSAEAALVIPGIGVRGPVSLSDDRWAVGDPAFSALVGWHGDNHHYLVSASVNVPVGSYDAGRLANVALNRWAGDISVAGTWTFPQNSIELSAATGITFNGENDDTDYETGTEFHLEASAFYQFTPAFSIGLNGYHYQQISGDSGAGATLGDFEGRVSAFGPGLSGTIQAGPLPVSVSLRYFHEFNVKNRLEGDSCWLTLSIPLWVPEQTP
ncbi:SphA family protein [Desulfosediminicola flagellatus]|uniref:SphA family protein n=1 Tax=Desulfosediminicola flagellatus TaxID=2569541 RepID=UPI00142EF6A1|nr:transporter [Desulfosediminicola flagellatus]